MDATVLPHVDGVGDIETIKRNGILANGAGEGVLEHADLIVVEVDIGEHVLQHHVDDVARLEQFVHTR